MVDRGQRSTLANMTRLATGFVSLLGSDPAGYHPHALHGPARAYRETNCYTDTLIELLHACGHEPLAAMGCTLRMDFEGDQWTFFKPFPCDLELLFGIDVHEMQPYRPLPEQAAEQIARGRTLIVELDSWYLPDTLATTYHAEHVKSSVVIEAIDPVGERLRYFHGTGLYDLSGEDYCGVFRLGLFSEDVLPPYTELVRFDAGLTVGRRGVARGGREDCCAGTLPGARRAIPSSASPLNLNAICRACSKATRATTTRTRSRL